MNQEQKIQKKRKFFSSRKLKYGALATVFTALFIAVVILFNVIVSAIDSKYRLYFDLTQDQIFSISDTTFEMVEEQLRQYREDHGEDPQIKISFLDARDIITDTEEKNWVVTLAESYAEKYPQITVEFKEDLKSHPENYTYYTDLGYSIDSNSIIISNSMEKGSFQVLTFDSCLVYNEAGTKVWAFQGEMKINAAIIKITTQKSPLVSFTTGHGEAVPQALVEILTNCGFMIENVDLTKDDISKESKILFMCAPQKDLTYSEDDSVVTEYTKISDYLNDYRSMVLIAAPNMPDLPVLDEILEDRGIKVHRNQIVMDDVSCHTNDNKMLYVNYTDTDRVGAALTNSLTSLTNPPRSLSSNSAPIEILERGDSVTHVTDAILQSSEHSYVEITTENGVEKKSGPFDLMVLSTRFTIVDNVNVYGHLLVIGSQNFTETNAFREQFGNTDIVFNMIKLLSREELAMETNYKVLEDFSLDMDQGEVYVYGAICTIVIPVAILAFGTVIYIRRKHR